MFTRESIRRHLLRVLEAAEATVDARMAAADLIQHMDQLQEDRPVAFRCKTEHENISRWAT